MVADPVDAALLELLGDGPATAAGLVGRLEVVSGIGLDLPDDAEHGVAARLQDWLRNGWVDLMDV